MVTQQGHSEDELNLCIQVLVRGIASKQVVIMEDHKLICLLSGDVGRGRRMNVRKKMESSKATVQ